MKNAPIHIKVEQAKKTDALLIAEMSRRTFYDTFAKDNTKEDMDLFLDRQFTTKALIAEVENDDGMFFLAYTNDVPCGYARIRLNGAATNEKGAVEIARLYVEKSAIGTGAGSLLMEKCMETAKALDKQLVWLGVWEKNERAIRFYKKWGFEKFGEQIFKLGNDLQTDWLMKRAI